MTQQEMIEKIVKTLDAKKAENIRAIGVKDLTILADCFIIANGSSTTQTRTLADEVEFQLSQLGAESKRRESDSGNTWIILDYSDVIVHIFYKETRNFYQLEKLWADGEQLDISGYLD